MDDPARLDPDDLERVLEHRSSNLAIRAHVAECIREGRPIDPSLRKFAAVAVLGDAIVPSRGRERTPEWWTFDGQLQTMVRWAVHAIVNAGLANRTRNDATKVPVSACDAVAEAGKRFDLDLSYRQVRKITER